jgi:hypothetical protein
VFTENQRTDPDDQASDPGSANVPGARVRLSAVWLVGMADAARGAQVRRQTRNIVDSLELAAQLGAAYHLMMEDDFLMCAHVLKVLQYIIEKVRRGAAAAGPADAGRRPRTGRGWACGCRTGSTACWCRAATCARWPATCAPTLRAGRRTI